ncbi:MAG: hypothetical protein ACR2P5_04520 [Gammaproteobacteria bacterium]
MLFRQQDGGLYQLRASRRLAALFIFGGAMAIGGALLLPGSSLLRALLIAAIIARIAAAVWRHAWRRGRLAVCGIRFDGEDEIALLDNGGGESGGVLRAAFVSPPLTVLRIAPQNGAGVLRRLFGRAVVLMPDCFASPDAYRRLRVRLNTAPIGGKTDDDRR